MKLYQIDAFTEEVFKGNPAAVCLLEEDRSKEFMLNLAVENNLSETAYVQKRGDRYSLRWFTPAKEVPLCGHATLASSFVLFSENLHSKKESIRFDTLSGELVVQYEMDGSLRMDFPANYAEPYACDFVENVEKEFGGALAEVLVYPDELILIFKELNTVLQANPDSGWISTLATNGVIVSAWSGSEAYDFASRYFAPNLGIPEDPVTGFMHTILTPYWAKIKGKNKFKAFQASTRTGNLETEWIGERVILKGKAVKVFETELSV